MNKELTEDQKLVLETYDRVAKEGFGDVLFTVHRHRLVKRQRIVKDDVPQRLKEIDNGH